MIVKICCPFTYITGASQMALTVDDFADVQSVLWNSKWFNNDVWLQLKVTDLESRGRARSRYQYNMLSIWYTGRW